MSAKRVLRSSAKAVSDNFSPPLLGKDDAFKAINVIGKSRKRSVKDENDGEPAITSQDILAPSKKKVKKISMSKPLEVDLGQGNNPRPEHNALILHQPTEPHETIPNLQVPGCSRPIANAREAINFHASESHLPIANGTLLEQACDHLIRVDSRLKPLIEKYPCQVFSTEGLAEEVDPFESLCNGILSQQVSGAAAKSIRNKFIALFHTTSAGNSKIAKYPQPLDVAACDISFLRQAGLSQRKAEYIKGLAERFVSGELSAAILLGASDEEVMKRLTAVRGLGKWSVEMFACFGLKRMDVLSTGDLGVQYDFLSTKHSESNDL